MINILIVESENDQYFVEALVSHLNKHIEIEPPICRIDDYECLEGLSLPRLTETLLVLRNQLQRRDIQKIGIILDMNDKTQADRLHLVNEALAKAFSTSERFADVSQFLTVTMESNLTVQIACYFTNVNGNGINSGLQRQPATFLF